MCFRRGTCNNPSRGFWSRKAREGVVLSNGRVTHRVNRRVVVAPFGPGQLGPGDCGLALTSRLVICSGCRLSVGGGGAKRLLGVPRRNCILRPGGLCLNHARRCAGAAYFIPVLRNHSSIKHLKLFVRIATKFKSIKFSNC